MKTIHDFKSAYLLKEYSKLRGLLKGKLTTNNHQNGKNIHT